MTNRTVTLIVVVAIVAVLTVAACIIVGLLASGTGGLLSSNEPTSTPTKTPKPTYTVTLTPTNTPIPTDTPLPTDTATPTPLATNTPIVYTATPTPTDTPLPTDTPAPPTNTPRPTPRPTRRPTATKPPPQPTNTPKPQFPWRGEPAGTFSNCGWTGFIGLALDRNGGVAGDIVVHYWADGWEGDWAKSAWTVDEGYPGKGDEKNWDANIANFARPGTWYACVVSEDGSWDCISNRMTMQSVHEPCSPGSEGVQVLRIVFQQN